MPLSNLTERFLLKKKEKKRKKSQFPFLGRLGRRSPNTTELLTKVEPPPDVFPFKTNKSRKISSLEFLGLLKKAIFLKSRGRKWQVLRDTKGGFERKAKHFQKIKCRVACVWFSPFTIPVSFFFWAVVHWNSMKQNQMCFLEIDSRVLSLEWNAKSPESSLQFLHFSY